MCMTENNYTREKVVEIVLDNFLSFWKIWTQCEPPCSSFFPWCVKHVNKRHGEKMAPFIHSKIVNVKNESRPIFCFWPTRPRPNRWSLFSHRVSVHPSVTKTQTRYNANVGAQKTKHSLQQAPCVWIMTTYWLRPGGSLFQPILFSSFMEKINSDLFNGKLLMTWIFLWDFTVFSWFLTGFKVLLMDSSRFLN